MSVIELVRDIWMNNACVKFEERRSCDQLLRVGFTLFDLFPDIADRISSI